MEPTYKLGEHGLAVPMELHKINRSQLCDRLHNLSSQSDAPISNLNGMYVVLQGGSAVYHGGSDSELVFRQESYFHWAFGGLEPNWYGAIDVTNKRAVLFVPKIPENAVIFMGDQPSLLDIKQMYAVDEVYYTADIAQFFEDHKAALLLTLHGINSDSNEYTLEAKFDGINKFKVNNTVLHHEISECRLIKSALELKVIRYAVETSSAAHRHLMRNVKPGMYQFQAESMFMHYCYFYGGMRHCAYTCIAASGCDCAILHYGHAGAPNERQINNGDMCLFDMGGEYYCYCSDITCSFPINGRFTADQKLIYESVLAANRAVIDRICPGVSWSEMHQLSERVMLQHLLVGGLVTGSVDEMMEHCLGAVFMPHGLGHLMGCDVHDVGGYNKDTPTRSSTPGLRNLRTARKLKTNMVLTVEPGCYFIDRILSQAKSSPILSKFLVSEVLARFVKFGGVRIEDDVLVTETGCEVLSTVPRTVEEIEDWMSREHTEYDQIK